MLFILASQSAPSSPQKFCIVASAALVFNVFPIINAKGYPEETECEEE
jgi:hypothetical protein